MHVAIWLASSLPAGVCVRLRDMVELLFPERIAARRTELERQAALQKKRSVERFQQEGMCWHVQQPKVCDCMCSSSGSCQAGAVG
jgi:hypothetical protein